MLRWEITSEPGSEPITTSEAKTYLRVDHTDDDTLIGALISVVRRRVEKDTGLAFISQTRKAYVTSFPPTTQIQLPGTPVTSITSITYIDDGGTRATWDSSEYELRHGEPDYVQLGFDYDWPDHRSKMDDVEIIYDCGEASANDVSELAKHCIKVGVELEYDRDNLRNYEATRRAYDALRNSIAIGEEFVKYGA